LAFAVIAAFKAIGVAYLTGLLMNVPAPGRAIRLVPIARFDAGDPASP
jgi:hypothetical protein